MGIGTLQFTPSIVGTACNFGVTTGLVAGDFFVPPFTKGGEGGFEFSGIPRLQGLDRFILRNNGSGGAPKPDIALGGEVSGFRSGMKLMDDFPAVPDLTVFMKRIKADLEKLSDEGRLAYINHISSGIEHRFYKSPSDDVSILHARIDLIHWLAREASSAYGRLPIKDANNPYWTGHADLWNLFNPFALTAVAIEEKLVRQGPLDLKVSEQIADIIYELSSKGALYYGYTDGDPLSAFTLIPDVIVRYRVLGLSDKAERAEQLVRDVQKRFSITGCPFKWALEKIKMRFDELIQRIAGEADDRVREILIGTFLNGAFGFKPIGMRGNYRFAAEISKYYADALFDAVQKMKAGGVPENVWLPLDEAITHLREKYSKAREMGIAIGTIVEANVIEGFHRIFSAPGAGEKFAGLYGGVSADEFIELVEKGEHNKAIALFCDYFGNDAKVISTIISMDIAREILRDEDASLGKRWRVFVDTVEGNPQLREYLGTAPWFENAYSDLKRGLEIYEKASHHMEVV